MDVNELKKGLYLIICITMLMLSILFILGDMPDNYNIAVFFTVKVFGMALAVGAYKGLKQTGILQWLSK
jgi:hypothetical protein